MTNNQVKNKGKSRDVEEISRSELPYWINKFAEEMRKVSPLAKKFFQEEITGFESIKEHKREKRILFKKSEELRRIAINVLKANDRYDLLNTLIECWYCKDSDQETAVNAGAMYCPNKKCSKYKQFVDICKMLYGDTPENIWENYKKKEKERDSIRNMYV